MSAKCVEDAAQVIHAAMRQGKQSAGSFAAALESAQLLMSPETAAELERLRAEVKRLRADRADEHDELAMALGHSNGTEWADLIEFAAGAVSVEAKLRARVAELEAQRDRRRVRLVALQNDALNMRGSLSPMGEDRKVPFPLGETLTPAVDWLISRVAELEAGPALPWAAAMDDGDLHLFLDDLVSAALNRWQSEPDVPDRVTLAEIEKACAGWRTPGQGFRSDEPEVSADALTRTFLPVASLREDADAGEAGQRVEWCTGCNTDHDPDQCGYQPETGGAS